MKILSVFSQDNEISIRQNSWGKEKVYYNGQEVSGKYSFFGAVHSFEVQEGRDFVEYVIKIGFNGWGVGANVWRNGKPLSLGLRTSYDKCKPVKRWLPPSNSNSGSSYHNDLV